MFATWLYVSTSAVSQNADQVIGSIQSTARSRNPVLGLTGVLISSGRHFAQFLEGPSAGLTIMKASILRDDRHSDIITLPTQAIRERRYGHWALAYAGWATAIDRVLTDALRDNDPRELLRYMDEFVEEM